MQANIARLGQLLVALFALVGLALGYWQVVRGPELSADPRNPRLGEAAARLERGRILDRNGSPLAESVATDRGFVRRYADPVASAATGYYSPRYGSVGIEAAFDRELRGERSPDLVSRLRAGLTGQQPVGSDVILTIDDRVQRAAAEAMGGARGAVVALDPRSGAVLALLANPSYDPNRIDGDWEALLQDPGRPLFNRALEATYIPGSTFKTLVAAAALDRGVVDPDRRYSCTTAIKIGDLSVDCRNHSQLAVVNFVEAFAWSCNRTFALTTLGLGQPGPLDLSNEAKRPYPWERDGIEASVAALRDYGRRFGFEQPPSFDLPVATSRLSDPGQEFFPSLLGQTGFGQGQVVATPLEMALLVATIANDGLLPRPYLVSGVSAPSGVVEDVHRPGQTGGRAVSSDVAKRLNGMLELSVQTAYAQKAKIPGVKVAGKTGTAETGEGRTPHSWFIGYAPSDAPRIAVAVILENRGSGSDFATPVGQQVMVKGLAVSEGKR